MAALSRLPLLALALLLTITSAANNSVDYVTRNLQTIQSIYNLTVFPNNVPILAHGASAVPGGLFNENATGRVSPVGNFSGFDDSIEYFFALAPAPSNGTDGVGIYEANVVEFTSGCPTVAASTVYLRTGTVNGTTGAFIPSNTTTTLKQVRAHPNPHRISLITIPLCLVHDRAHAKSSLSLSTSDHDILYPTGRLLAIR